MRYDGFAQSSVEMPRRSEKICKDDLEFGMCSVNKMVASNPQLPFGGIKSSGFGRELAEFGLKEFANIKTILIN